MDAEQLTLLPGRTVWTLRDEAAPRDGGVGRSGSGLRVIALPGRGTTEALVPESVEAVDPAPAALLQEWWRVDGAAADRTADTPEPAPARSRRATSTAVVARVAVAVAVLALALAGAGWLAGLRWFVVQTPSMGTAAPVGTLVVTAPVERPAVGEVIAFTPPGAPRTYTHRVVAVDASGIRTKGDINGAADPWTIRPDAVIGRAVALLPGAGYAVRGLPPLAAGLLLLLLLTAPIRRRDRRASARVIGGHLVVTGVLLWLHPFVQLTLIGSERAGDAVRASVVSTGLLPVRLVDAAGAELARLATGRPEVVDLPAAAGRVLALPDLPGPLQLALAALAVLPALAVLVVGLPAEDRADA
ncbi:S26 family signal peptidase [Amnibacterium setariae]|uniref:S26 family signal peptidase n=1 Tax=Amnibacterium setariae TaxID=2306585 RepID=UPI0018F48683|nr:S26 family signal peptidase [Amnibacterium setariae]